MEDMIKETAEYDPDVAVKPKPTRFKSSGPTLDSTAERLSKTTWPSSRNDSKGKGKEKPTNSKAGGKWAKKKGGPGNHGQEKKNIHCKTPMYNNSVYLIHWYYPFLFIQMNHCDVTINNGVVD